MKTISFIGSNKNVGKTTALLYYLDGLMETEPPQEICVTSIGINGEGFDQISFKEKPQIVLNKGNYFVTSADRLEDSKNRFELISEMWSGDSSETYILGKALSKIRLVIEGPNTKREVIAMKENLKTIIPNGFLLLDGSIDRMFAASPDIADEVVPVITMTDQYPQKRGVDMLLMSLWLPICDSKTRQFIERHLEDGVTSLLWDMGFNVFYRGKSEPFLDRELLNQSKANQQRELTLYLNGMFGRLFQEKLNQAGAPSIVLNNFTQYQNGGGSPFLKFAYEKKMKVLRSVLVKRLFIKNERGLALPEVPGHVEIIDLFRDKL